ncbi:MAG: hypothetical protein IT313_05705 [Anaerolineales bacterium]|nr:hypothetical protein [Anaerolineales bacterium]
MELYLDIPLCCGIYLVFSTLLAAFAGYAYLVNLKRPADDPRKKRYHVSGIFVMPFFWPLLLVGWVSFFIIRALHLGLFLIAFTFAVACIRKPFLIGWLEKIALKVGGKLLDANAALIRLTFGESPSAG